MVGRPVDLNRNDKSTHSLCVIPVIHYICIFRIATRRELTKTCFVFSWELDDVRNIRRQKFQKMQKVMISHFCPFYNTIYCLTAQKSFTEKSPHLQILQCKSHFIHYLQDVFSLQKNRVTKCIKFKELFKKINNELFFIHLFSMIHVSQYLLH